MPAALGHYDDHPRYPCQAFHAGKKVKCGRDRPNVPNWEDEVMRGVPWFSGGGLDSDDRGVNLAGIAFDWITDPLFGLSQPESLLDATSWNAVKDETDDMRVSPLITQQADADQAFGQLFEYGNLFVRPTRDGKLELGRWKVGAEIDVDALPRIGSDDLTEEPDTTSLGYSDTVNQVRVVFSDREHDYKQIPCDPASDASNFRIVGERRAITLQRLWLTDRLLANRLAAEHCKAQSQPALSGSIKVKRERVKALGIREGVLFWLDAASYGLSLALRCTDLEWPADRDGICTLTIENERSIYPRLFIPPPSEPPNDFTVSPVAIQHARITELPQALTQTVITQVAVLAQRPSPAIVGFRIYASADGVTYDLLSGQQDFAAYGRLTSAYPATTNLTDTTVGMQVEMFGVDTITPQTDSQRDDNTLLAFIAGEIITVGISSALGSGVLRVYGKRSVFGTPPMSHPIGTEVWFIRREQLVMLANALFAAGSTRYFKLQPYTASADYDLTLVDPIVYTFDQRIPYHIANLQLLGHGNGTTYTGKNPVFTWDGTVAFGPPSLEVDPLAAPYAEYTEYHVRVRHPVTGEIVFTDTTFSPPYLGFDYERNVRAFGKPERAAIFEVQSLHRQSVNGVGVESAWASLPYSNPAPPKVSPTFFSNGGSGVLGIWTAPIDLDFIKPRYRVHRSQSSGFTPSSANLIYDGPDNRVPLEQPPGTWFYRVAAVDEFGPDELNYSDEVSTANNSLSNYTEDLPPVSVTPGDGTEFDPSVDLTPTGVPGATIVLKRDGTTALPDSAKWPGAVDAWDVLTLTASTVLSVRQILGTRISPEWRGRYTLVPGGGGGGGGSDPPCGLVAIHKVGGNSHLVSLTCGTPGCTIHYQYELADGTLTGWSTTTSGSQKSVGPNVTIYAYASAPGFSDGPLSDYTAPGSGL